MLNFTFEALDQAHSALQRIKDFIYELEHRTFKNEENSEILKLIKITKKKFIDGLSDDLNISLSLSALYGMIRKVNTLLAQDRVGKIDAEKLMKFVGSIDKILAVLPKKKEKTLPSDIKNKIKDREKARNEKNFALADKIRNELLLEGIILEDTPEGVRWKKKKREKVKGER